jgi:hypothetical protein
MNVSTNSQSKKRKRKGGSLNPIHKTSAKKNRSSSSCILIIIVLNCPNPKVIGTTDTSYSSSTNFACTCHEKRAGRATSTQPPARL